MSKYWKYLGSGHTTAPLGTPLTSEEMLSVLVVQSVKFPVKQKHNSIETLHYIILHYTAHPVFFFLPSPSPSINPGMDRALRVGTSDPHPDQSLCEKRKEVKNGDLITLCIFTMDHKLISFLRTNCWNLPSHCFVYLVIIP